ncbi:hypothetical protein AYJ54_45785 [Bradyrhizobium centrolobii]|uniref:Uncharacterized protein n=1 Tax=Bradyrhizobium centrolobii TaxID=1505087 RepID=A0A176YZ48_9BRAD|nr:hypothetical protein AYJ54_45785 [Bradyrhizobium centrolobii]
MSRSYLNRHLKMMRFMGFRQCPNCKECLFAAEGAQFFDGVCINLCWRCDACGHAFSTNVDSRGRTTRSVAA